MTILHSIKNRYDEYMDAEWIPFLRHLTGRDYHYLTRRQHAIHNICGPKRQVSQSVSFDPDNIGKASGWQSLRAPRGRPWSRALLTARTERSGVNGTCGS